MDPTPERQAAEQRPARSETLRLLAARPEFVPAPGPEDDGWITCEAGTGLVRVRVAFCTADVPGFLEQARALGREGNEPATLLDGAAGGSAELQPDQIRVFPLLQAGVAWVRPEFWLALVRRAAVRSFSAEPEIRKLVL